MDKNLIIYAATIILIILIMVLIIMNTGTGNSKSKKYYCYDKDQNKCTTSELCGEDTEGNVSENDCNNTNKQYYCYDSNENKCTYGCKKDDGGYDDEEACNTKNQQYYCYDGEKCVLGTVDCVDKTLKEEDCKNLHIPYYCYDENQNECVTTSDCTKDTEGNPSENDCNTKNQKYCYSPEEFKCVIDNKCSNPDTKANCEKNNKTVFCYNPDLNKCTSCDAQGANTLTKDNKATNSNIDTCNKTYQLYYCSDPNSPPGVPEGKCYPNSPDKPCLATTPGVNPEIISRKDCLKKFGLNI